MKAPLHLVHAAVQTPAAPPARAYRWDASWPAPHTEALRAAWNDGENAGHRVGYMQGWRWGLVCGATWSALGAGVALVTYLTWWR